VTFAGTASDAEDGDLTASLSWSSNLDGAIGSGGTFSTSTLSVGTHTVTAAVTDSGGLSGSAAITVTITAANTSPTVSITAPADGSSFNEGANVTFSGSASDAEDGDLTASLSWSSNLDGAIGSGGSFSISTLSVGTHTVTASVTDSGGLSGSAAITVTIAAVGGPITVTLNPVAAEEGWVREKSEFSNTGGAAKGNASGSAALRVGDHKKDKQWKTILSFDTSSIPDGAVILSATLRMKRGKVVGTNPFTILGSCLVDIQTGGFGGNTALAASDFQAAATAVGVATMSNPLANGDWSEGVLDANGLAAVNVVGTTQLRVYFTLDDNDNLAHDYVGFYSQENANAANHPELVVTYQ